MQKWWNWVLGIGLFCLLFVAIPLSYSGGNGKQQMSFVFDDYIKMFNKTYKKNTPEYETRLKYFMTSLEEIEKMNAVSLGPEEHKARFGLTRLSDMSKAEYKEIHLSDERIAKSPPAYGRTWHDRSRNHSMHRYDVDDNNKQVDHRDSPDGSNEIIHNHLIFTRKRRAAAPTLPMKVDWRSKGLVGAVRNQGLCGACWAFSTIGTMETMAAIASGMFVPLSVQEVIDCAGLGNSGCAGGDICLLLDWLTITDAAIEKDSEYPLKLTNGVCQLKKNATGVKVKSFTCDSFVGDEEKILEAIATHGPVAVAVNALSWQNYLGGVIQFHCSGAAADMNHAVELIGYDLTAEVPHYIAKNSWGAAFGNDGYLKLAIGSNVCGLANEVATVDVK